MSRPRTPEEWRDWREGVRAPWIARAQTLSLGAALQIAAPAARLKGRAEKVGPCPACGGRDRFAVNDAKGVWHCRGAGDGGASPIGLAMHCAGLDFLSATALLAGEPDPARPGAPPETAEDVARREAARREREAEAAAAEARRLAAENGFRAREQERARAIVLGAAPWRGSFVELYLRHRGVLDDAVIGPLAGLRLRAATLPYWVDGARESLGDYPCMVAAFVRTNQAGGAAERDVIGAHLTYLDPAFVDGSAPASPKGKLVLVDPETGAARPAKKMRGSQRGDAAGWAIRLLGPRLPRVLVRGEGIETTIAFAAALARAGRLAPDMAFWAAGSQAALGGPHDGTIAHPTDKDRGGRPRRAPGPEPRAADADHPCMVIPESVRVMIDLADADCDPVAMAAVLERSRRRWSAPDRAVVAIWPPAGLDWAEAVGAM